MSYASDDLAAVLVPPEREWSGYGQGILRSFNTDTFANTVEYRGALLHDLPVLPGLDALGWVAGDIVLLMKWKPAGGRGVASYWLAGNPVIPGTGTGEKKVAVLRSNVAREISAEIFADRIYSDEVTTSESTGSSSYTDLATTGPTVSDVEITSGRALVFVSGRIRAEQANNGDSESFMSFTVSGATSLSADDTRAASTWIRLSNHAGGDNHTVDVAMRGTAQIPLEGLNEGLHTFQAKYRVDGVSSNFGVRALTVIAF